MEDFDAVSVYATATSSSLDKLGSALVASLKKLLACYGLTARSDSGTVGQGNSGK